MHGQRESLFQQVAHHERQVASDTRRRNGRGDVEPIALHPVRSIDDAIEPL
jgi:hypothetical protein